MKSGMFVPRQCRGVRANRTADRSRHSRQDNTVWAEKARDAGSVDTKEGRHPLQAWPWHRLEQCDALDRDAMDPIDVYGYTNATPRGHINRSMWRSGSLVGFMSRTSQ